MSPPRQDETSSSSGAVIVGGGISGLSLAILLAEQGIEVRVLEKRPDPRVAYQEGRTINFTLSGRGRRVLERLGLAERALAAAVRMESRVVHLPGGGQVAQSYGGASQLLYALKRRDLIVALLERALASPGVQVEFNVTLDELSPGGELRFRRQSGASARLSPAFIVGADGVHSWVRGALGAREAVSVEQHTFSHGYAELTISQGDGRRLGISAQALHVWPGRRSALVAIPNVDGSFSCCFIVESGVGVDAIEAAFHADFPALYRASSSLRDSARSARYSALVRTRVSTWNSGDLLVLVGDACHAVYPFFGQGMNAALEDALALSTALGRYPSDRRRAFAEYHAAQKPNADALDELSIGHFDYLKVHAASARFHGRQLINAALLRLLPSLWHHEYALVAHSDLPYAEARRIIQRQAALRSALGLTVVERILAGAITGIRWLRRPVPAKRSSHES
ncbi:NAD(P)/FAD-dependent oxidoreductase [Sorangium sp. So ce1036]|uniref:FAD-dependent oxidoreductase n=1 Tax=Sorangium sp. So ce1036 TaxID=3133328 RepID=UPI003F0AEA0A